jgi:hypothetical protein
MKKRAGDATALTAKRACNMTFGSFGSADPNKLMREKGHLAALAVPTLVHI